MIAKNRTLPSAGDLLMTQGNAHNIEPPSDQRWLKAIAGFPTNFNL
jgi:hypothetical protein